MKNKIYLIGDSFTDNLYKEQLFQKRMNFNEGVGQIRKYIDSIYEDTGEYPIYFDEWLTMWGYDVYNFGLGGCSIYHTFNQFARIKLNEFNVGDRIIVNWTSPIRLDWLVDNGDVQIIQGTYAQYQNDKPDASEALIDQSLLRASSLHNEDGKGYLRKETIPFMSRLVDLHKAYHPIQWSPFPNISDFISKEMWYFYEPNNSIFKDYIQEYDALKIYGETGGKCVDEHYSRYGNYYLALILKTIIEHNFTTPNYTLDDNLLDKVFDVVKNNRPNFKKVNWSEKTKIYL